MTLPDITPIRLFKESLAPLLGLSYDALHIYVGLAVLFITAAIIRKPLHARLPWLVVLSVTLAGEWVDLSYELLMLGHWQWQASLHDALNTLFWPSVLVLASKYGPLCASAARSKT